MLTVVQAVNNFRHLSYFSAYSLLILLASKMFELYHNTVSEGKDIIRVLTVIAVLLLPDQI